MEPRPELTYEQMRAGTENSGNVRENKSLYWHPTVYKVNQQTGEYTMVPTWFASAYYIWKPNGEDTVAFPDGFRMIARAGSPRSRVLFTCDGESACERADGCSSSADADTFPQNACGELEIKIVFPVCWNGVDLDSENHMSHMAYDIEEGSEGAFDGECPSTHPIRVPEIQFYFRILNYEGGEHRFSTDDYTLHADYWSGWNATELQYVLENCQQNNSTAANPDAWCNDVLTFTDEPKTTGDSTITERLEASQPTTPLNSSATITSEAITGFTSLPRGARTGTLIGGSDSGGGGSDTGGSDDNNSGGSSSSGSDDNTMVIVLVAAGAIVGILVLVGVFIYGRSKK